MQQEQARNDDVARMHNRVTFSLSHSYTWLHIRPARSLIYTHACTRASRHTGGAYTCVTHPRNKGREKDTLVTPSFLPNVAGTSGEGHSILRFVVHSGIPVSQTAKPKKSEKRNKFISRDDIFYDYISIVCELNHHASDHLCLINFITRSLSFEEDWN